MEKTVIGAERCLLGCVLLGSHLSEIFTSVTGEDFISAECRNLFFQLRGHWQQFGKVDAGCVPFEHRKLAAECAGFVPSLSNWKSYITRAKNDAAKQKAQGIALSIASGNMELEEIRQCANTLVLAAQGQDAVRRMDIRKAVDLFWKEQERPAKYLHTGIEKLDKTAFIESGDYVVVGARPSTGKTAFALKVAKHLAQQGMKTVFYSYETRVEKLIGRTMAAHCGISMPDIKNRRVEKGEKTEHLTEDLTGLPFEFVESSGKGIDWIKSDVIRSKAQAVVLDYIGMVPGLGESRYEKITGVSLAIREMCQSTGVAAFVLCQINRQGKTAPGMEDLKESGQIEQDADIVMLLHNPEDIKTRKAKSVVQLIVAKNKEGETGCVELVFDGLKQEFYERKRYG